MNYKASRGDQNDIENSQNSEQLNNNKGDKQSFGSKLVNGAGKAKNAYDSYKANGGLGGMAKNAIGNKINDKVNEKKDQIKDVAKNKVNGMVPESVKKKQQAIKGKMDAAKKKLNAPKEKINQAKQKLNEKTFKTGVRTAVNAAAPGAGKVAEKLLDTPQGKPAVEAARNASNPISGLKEGTKKLVEIVVKKATIKKIVIPFVSVFSGVVVFMVIMSSILKFGDSQTYAHGAAFDGDSTSIEKLDEKYVEFYENIEYYSAKYYADKAMIIAALTAYQDNEIYSDMDAIDSSVVDIDPDEDIDGDGITDLSTSKMKKYIKKVGKAIQKSGGNVAEGDYVKRDTGSDYFWWLYDDFVEDYYEDYFGSSMSAEEISKKKKEIIEFIYLYYEDIKAGIGVTGLAISNLCPSGITVTGNDAGTYDLEEYVAGVVSHEAYLEEGMEALKAQAIAARTYVINYTSGCTKPIQNNANAQTFYKNANPRAKEATNATAGMVLMYDGKTFASEYDSFCYADSGCPDSKKNADGSYSVTYTKIPSDEKHLITLKTSKQTKRIVSGRGHARGMSQLLSYEMAADGKTSDEILKYFYSDNVTISTMGLNIAGGIVLGSSGIYASSIFPINTSVSPIENIILTQGYRYDGGGEHGAIDLFCNRSKAPGDVKEFCTSIPIVAAHSGTVVSVTNNQYCANPENSNDDKDLPVYSSCGGNGIVIQVTDKSDVYYGYKFTYWHFDKVDPNIKNGTQVTTGQFLGYMGSTGNSTGWHLHFAITNSSGQKINQNNNILNFCTVNGLVSDGIRPTSEGPSG